MSMSIVCKDGLTSSRVEREQARPILNFKETNFMTIVLTTSASLLAYDIHYFKMFELVPDDVMYEIILCFNAATLQHFASTCVRFRYLVNQPTLGKRMFNLKVSQYTDYPMRFLIQVSKKRCDKSSLTSQGYNTLLQQIKLPCVLHDLELRLPLLAPFSNFVSTIKEQPNVCYYLPESLTLSSFRCFW